MNDNASPNVILSGVPVESVTTENQRFCALLWGPAGSGKTTLASTLPGKKLVLGFDPDGELSLAERDDVQDVLRLYMRNPTTVVGEFKKTDPFGLTKFLSERTDIESVIFDSMTTYAYMALEEAVRMAGGAKISMEQPGMNGYTYRNSLVLRAATSMLAVTAKLNRNIIFTTHEGAPSEEDGSITMLLATNLANQIGLRINEVWHLRDMDGKSRTISVRPHSRMKPMKTRMFNADKPQFEWHFDANTMIGEGISDWWAAWKENGGRKIALPSVSRATATKGGAKKMAQRT